MSIHKTGAEQDSAPVFELNAARTRLVVTAGSVELDAAEADTLLLRLAKCRAEMVDTHSEAPAQTVWADGRKEKTGELVLRFLHPKYGWVQFDLSRKEEDRLSVVLRSRAAAALALSLKR